MDPKEVRWAEVDWLHLGRDWDR